MKLAYLMDRDELAVAMHKMRSNYDASVVLMVVVTINVESDAVADNGIVVVDALAVDKSTNSETETHIRVAIAMAFVAY